MKRLENPRNVAGAQHGAGCVQRADARQRLGAAQGFVLAPRAALALGAALATIVLIRHQRILQRYTYVAGLLAVWFIFYASMTWLLPQRQSLHDLICRTRLIDTRP